MSYRLLEEPLVDLHRSTLIAVESMSFSALGPRMGSRHPYMNNALIEARLQQLDEFAPLIAGAARLGALAARGAAAAGRGLATAGRTAAQGATRAGQATARGVRAAGTSLQRAGQAVGQRAQQAARTTGQFVDRAKAAGQQMASRSREFATRAKDQYGKFKDLKDKVQQADPAEREKMLTDLGDKAKEKLDQFRQSSTGQSAEKATQKVGSSKLGQTVAGVTTGVATGAALGGEASGRPTGVTAHELPNARKDITTRPPGVVGGHAQSSSAPKSSSDSEHPAPGVTSVHPSPDARSGSPGTTRGPRGATRVPAGGKCPSPRTKTSTDGAGGEKRCNDQTPGRSHGRRPV